MYIVGTQRSGSTAFAIHKALEAGIPFRGELSLRYVVQQPSTRINFKRLFHETGIQPDYTLSEYMLQLEGIDSTDSMYLLNAASSVPNMWSNASAFITRKNFRNILKSQANYLIKNNPIAGQERDVRLLTMDMTVTAISACLLLKYCNDHQKEITWYEDVFDRVTVYDGFEGYAHKEELEGLMDALIEEFRPELLNQSIIL